MGDGLIHTKYLDIARENFERAMFIVNDEKLLHERGTALPALYIEAGKLAMKLGKYGD